MLQLCIQRFSGHYERGRSRALTTLRYPNLRHSYFVPLTKAFVRTIPRSLSPHRGDATQKPGQARPDPGICGSVLAGGNRG